MSGETWTEYTIQLADGRVSNLRCRTPDDAKRVAECFNGVERIVGRTVTASDWLPVNTDGAL